MTTYTPYIPYSAIFSVIALLITMPALTFLAEFTIKKSLSRGNVFFTIIITSAVCSYFFMQIYSTQVKLDKSKITLHSISYSKSIQLSNVLGVKFYEAKLPEPYHAQWRKNGIGLYGYSVGHFKSIYNRDLYMQTTAPPYIVLVLKNEKTRVVISADKIFYEHLLGKVALHQTK